MSTECALEMRARARSRLDARVARAAARAVHRRDRRLGQPIRGHGRGRLAPERARGEHRAFGDDHAHVGLGSPPTTLDPRIATDANSQRIDDLLFSSLVRIGEDLRPAPQDATSWTIKNKKIIFKLRSDLMFQNGRLATAKDYIYSIGQYKKPSSPFSSALAHILKVTTENNDELIFWLDRDDASLLANLTNIKLLPQDIIDTPGSNFSTAPIGSGPYRLEKIDNQQIIIKKADQKSYAAAKIDRIAFKFVRDENTRFLKMLKGDLDILSNELPEEKVVDLAKTASIAVSVTPGLNFNYVLLNLKDSRLKQLAFRKALFAALNREEVIKYILENMGSIAGSILAPQNPFSASDLKFQKVTISAAKKQVTDLGLNESELQLKVSNQATANGVIISQQLESLGIKIVQNILEWGTFYSDVKAGRYQLALMRWVGIVDPDVYRDTLATSEFAPLGKNRGFYSNAQFDSLVEEARSEINFEARLKLYVKAQQIVASELPILPLWYNANISVLNKRVSGFKPIITGSFYPLLNVTKN